MNEKLSFQNIADTLAKKSGVQKKVADTFSKAFFDTIVEALTAGETIKIKGLGTFKLVEVDDRESVNVSTGKRFVIPGYKKVAFTAEDRVVEVLNERTDNTENEVVGHTDSTDNTDNITNTDSTDLTDNKEISALSAVSARDKKEESVQSVESVRDKKEVSVRDEQPQIEDLIQVPEPEKVETPQDAFAGIDTLISTPESVEEVRQQYEEAKAKMEVAVAEARKANAEKVRLERLLERLEKNVVPEGVHTEDNVVDQTDFADHTDSTDDEVVGHTDEKETSHSGEEKLETPVETESDDESKRQEAFNRVMSEPSQTEEAAPSVDKKSRKNWLIAAIFVLLTVLGTFVYLIYRNIEAVEQVSVAQKTTQPAKPTIPAKPVKPVASKVDKDSLVKAPKVDSTKMVSNAQKESPKPEATQKPAEPSKPERPKTHRVQRGESLTRISQIYYGTKDSVRAILRVNAFNDPNNIPVGAVVNLP